MLPSIFVSCHRPGKASELICERAELWGNVNVGMYVGVQEETPSSGMSEHGMLMDYETMFK